MAKNILLPITGIKQRPIHCGPACIEMILKFYGYVNVDQVIVGKDLRVKFSRGCYPYQVIKYLKRFNIIAEKSKKIEDIERISEGNPIVLGQMDHFMLLIGREGNEYFYIDPATGRKNKDTLDYFKREMIDIIIITKVEKPDGRKGKNKRK